MKKLFFYILVLDLFLIHSKALQAFDLYGSWPIGPCYVTAISDDYAYMGSGGFLGIVDLDTYALISQTILCNHIVQMSEKDGFLYVTASNDGLLIVDVSDPTNPTIVADIPGYTMNSLVAGNKLYLACSTAGVKVYDITDPRSPQHLGTGNEWGYSRDIAVYGDYGYVAQSSMGLKIIDVSDPASMDHVADIEITNNTAVVVSVYQGYLYVGSLGEDGFEIFDLTDPTAPQSVNYIDVGSSYKFQFMNNYMFLAAVGDGLVVYDISDPVIISRVYTFEDDMPYDVAITQNYVSLAEQDEGLRVYPVTDNYLPGIINSIELDFTANSFWANNNCFYFPVHGEGVKIWNISGPFQIEDYGFYDLLPHDICFGNDAMYMSFGDEIHIVDNDDPANPVKIKDIEVNGKQFGLRLDGFNLFAYSSNAVTDGYYIHILDVSDAGSPRIVASMTHGTFFTRAEIYQNSLYLLDFDNMLYRVDIEDPVNAVLSGPVFTDSFDGFWMKDQYAYLKSTDGTSKIYDCTDPAALTLVNSLTNIDLSSKPLFIGSWGYSPGFMGKDIIDFSNPTAPVKKGFLDIGGYIGQCLISNGRLYVQKIIMENKINIYDLSQPLNPAKLGDVATFGRNRALAVQDGVTYAANSSGGLYVLDFNRSGPPELSHIDLDGNVDNVALAGDFAYLAESGTGLRIVDITDTEKPVPVGVYTPATNSTVKDVIVDGHYAYLIGGPYNDVIDIADPQNPQHVGDIPSSSNCGRGCVYNNFLYVAEAGNGLKVIDVTGPENPELAATVDTPGWAYDVKCVNDFACVADGPNHMRIMDISDPALPTEISSVEIPYATVMAVDIFDHYALLACDYRGIYIIDISGPENPTSLGSIYIADHDFNDVVVENGYIYATAEMNGVFKFGHELITAITDQPGVPDRFDLFNNYPNPFNPATNLRYSLPTAELVTIDIYNINGQHVKKLMNIKQSAGMHIIQWNGKDDNGLPVSSGVYFGRMRAGDFVKTQKMLLVK